MSLSCCESLGCRELRSDRCWYECGETGMRMDGFFGRKEREERKGKERERRTEERR